MVKKKTKFFFESFIALVGETAGSDWHAFARQKVLSLLQHLTDSLPIDSIHTNNGYRSSRSSAHMYSLVHSLHFGFSIDKGQTPSALCTFYSKSSARLRGVLGDTQGAFRFPSGETDRQLKWEYELSYLSGQ